MKTINLVPGRTQVAMGVALLAIGAFGLLPWRVTAQTAGTAANEKGNTEKLNHESQMRLKQLGAVLLMYAQDYDEVLPPMESPSAVKKVIYPYVRRSDAALLDPHTNEPYQPNPTVSRCQVVGTVRTYDSVHNRWTTYLSKRGRHAPFMRVRGYITALAQSLAFYEPRTAPDGTRGVLFLDGHVARVSEAEWQRLKKASGVP